MWISGSWSKTRLTPAAPAAGTPLAEQSGGARAAHGLSVALDGCLCQAPLLPGRHRGGAGSLSRCFPFAAPAGVRKAAASTGWDSSALAQSLLHGKPALNLSYVTLRNHEAGVTARLSLGVDAVFSSAPLGMVLLFKKK